MRTLVLGLALLVARFAPALADDAEPWADGVAAGQQARANALFAEGNALFTQLAHAAALDKYRAAVALWDHPMVRFNMAVTLIRLDRPLEAADELERALRYGAAPFDPDLYQQARDYQALIKRQLGYLEVTADQPGTQIVLDGKPWFEGPGTRTVRVTTGEHTVVAARTGYLTVSRSIVVAGGTTVHEQVALVPLEAAVILRYRHPRWLPWAVAGAGAAIALGGVGFTLAGRAQMDRFAERFVGVCPGGCEADLGMYPELAAERDGAHLKGDIGAALMITGGVVGIGGVVWAILNRPTRHLPAVDHRAPSGSTARPSYDGLAFEAAPAAGGIRARATWRF